MGASTEWTIGLSESCSHMHLSITKTALYCVALSTCFVGSLYALVPSRIRRLDRDNIQQIRGRMFAVSMVSLVSTLTYPLVFCNIAMEGIEGSPSALEFMGWKWHLRTVLGVLAHTASLYFGSIATMLVQVIDRYARSPADTSFSAIFFSAFIKPVVSPYFDPFDESERWSQIRNIIMAPLTEEIVFRGCMMSPLLASGLGPIGATFIAPLFFGVAHAHHAILKLQGGAKPAHVIVLTAFQFTYTSLFGSYAAHVFIRTGSIPAVFLSHSFCNSMGLPDLSFLYKTGGRYSSLYQFRFFLLISYLIGVITFVWGIRSDMLLPLPSRLPELISV